MSCFSGIMGVVSSWITARGKIAERKYQRKIGVKEDKRWQKEQ